MTAELMSLTAITLFTGLMWIPYIANVVVARGTADALGFPDDPAPLAAWAERVDRAHRNAIENLAVFAPLVLVAHIVGVGDPTTVAACIVYSVVRAVHFFALVLAVPVVKSISFMVGSGCQVILALSILGA